jgi:hypothetical protein
VTRKAVLQVAPEEELCIPYCNPEDNFEKRQATLAGWNQVLHVGLDGAANQARFWSLVVNVQGKTASKRIKRLPKRS